MKQFVMFGLVGSGATAVHYAIFWAGMAVGLSPTFATAIGYLAGSVFSYIFNYRFTFASTARHTLALPSFYAMVAMGWVLNTALVYIGTAMANLSAWPVQIVATGLVFLFNFWVSRQWVFKS